MAGSARTVKRQQAPRREDEATPPRREAVWGRACSLRTQQRADHPHPTRDPLRHETRQNHRVSQGIVYDVSTHERTAPHTCGEASGHRPGQPY